MKKRLSLAKSPLPKIQSDQEAAGYFESHSVAGVWDQLAEAPQAKPSPALATKIRDRHARAKSPISLRLAPEQIAAAKRIAAAKSIGYQTQLRMWIAEGIRREAKRACLRPIPEYSLTTIRPSDFRRDVRCGWACKPLCWDSTGTPGSPLKVATPL